MEDIFTASLRLFWKGLEKLDAATLPFRRDLIDDKCALSGEEQLPTKEDKIRTSLEALEASGLLELVAEFPNASKYSRLCKLGSSIMFLRDEAENVRDMDCIPFPFSSAKASGPLALPRTIACSFATSESTKTDDSATVVSLSFGSFWIPLPSFPGLPSSRERPGARKLGIDSSIRSPRKDEQQSGDEIELDRA